MAMCCNKRSLHLADVNVAPRLRCGHRFNRIRSVLYDDPYEADHVICLHPAHGTRMMERLEEIKGLDIENSVTN